MRVRKQPLAGPCQFHPPRVPREEGLAESAFQLPDALADGRLCRVQRRRGPAEAPVLDGGQEDLEIDEIHSHRCNLWDRQVFAHFSYAFVSRNMGRMMTNELPTSANEVREFWDSAAPTYDSLAGHGLFAEVEREAWCRLLERVLGDEPRRVLDVGTGTGFLALRAAELGHDVTGVDVSGAMLAQAETSAARAGLAVNFVSCSSELKVVADRRFDAIVCRHLLWTLPQPERTLRRWREVLPDGGRIAAIDGTWFPTRGIDCALGRTGRALRRLSRRPRNHGSGVYNTRRVPSGSRSP